MATKSTESWRKKLFEQHEHIRNRECCMTCNRMRDGQWCTRDKKMHSQVNLTNVCDVYVNHLKEDLLDYDFSVPA